VTPVIDSVDNLSGYPEVMGRLVDEEPNYPTTTYHP
jgi:hypothetical protein